ncbi:response regulator [Kitasatospora sp. NPDC056138]|uniref:response regulator transcription factor n=1 Tax=Kitasatospora sp. NPDC056138 TaxID=3345724 RepID=UPI0035E21940
MTADPVAASTAERSVSLLIADDEEVTRSGLRTLLSVQPGLTVVGEATDGAEVLGQVRSLRPDVVLMDVRMPEVNGIEATRLLLSELSAPPKVVVITTFENDDYVYDALRVGASGFVLKRSPIQQIAQAVRTVATGDSLLFPDAVRRLVAARPVGPKAVSPAAFGLTGRESEILRLMAGGLSNPDIAAQLVVSLETVKTHVGNVLIKLQAQNRTHAVILAYESGFVVPGAQHGTTAGLRSQAAAGR